MKPFSIQHTCHARNCLIAVPPRILMCRRHWGLVTRDIQREIKKHYRPGQERDKRPSVEYLLAMEDAINCVALLEGYQEHRPLRNMLAAQAARVARVGR